MAFIHCKHGQPLTSDNKDPVSERYGLSLFSQSELGEHVQTYSTNYASARSIQRDVLKPIYFLLGIEHPNVHFDLRLSVVELRGDRVQYCTDFEGLQNELLASDGNTYSVPENIDTKLAINIVELRSGKSYLDKILIELENAGEIKQIGGLNALLTLQATTFVRTYYCAKKQCLTVVTTDNTLDTLRRTYAAIPLVLPLEFTPLAKEILKAFGTDDYTTYETLYHNWIKENDVLNKRKLKAYNNAFEYLATPNTQKLERDAESIRNSIQSYERTLRDYYNEQAAIQKKILAEQLNIEERKLRVQEFIEYVIKHPKVDNVKRDSGSSVVELLISTDLIYFEEDLVEKLCTKNVWDKSNNFNRMMKEIFAERKYVLEIHHRVQWDLRILSLEGKAGYVSQDPNKCANPHIFHYNCFGSNSTEFAKCCNNNQYETALELLIASIGSMNFGDGAVRSRFVEDLVSRYWDVPGFIRDVETGEYYNPKTLIAKYKDEEEQAKQEELRKQKEAEEQEIREMHQAAEERRLRLEQLSREGEINNEIYTTTTGEPTGNNTEIPGVLE